jgi:hypothetical protein
MKTGQEATLIYAFEEGIWQEGFAVIRMSGPATS